MAHLLIVQRGLVGRRSASLGLAHRLRAAGQRVTVAGPEASGPQARQAGFDFRLLPDTELAVFGSRAGLPDDGLSPGDRSARGVATLGTAGFADLLTQTRPDLALIDFELHGHVMIAVASGLPTALFSTMFVGPEGWRTPPLNSAVVPGRGLGGSGPAIALRRIGYWAWKARTLRSQARRHKGGDYASVLRHHARTIGFDLARHVDHGRWQLPWSYRLPLLVFQPAELDFPAPSMQGIRHVGPMEAPGTEADHDPLPGPFVSAPAGRRVYVAFGSLITPPPGLVEAIWTLPVRNPSWRILFVRGRGGRIPIPRDRPPNLHVVDWAPQRAALEVADAAIMHGGPNTLIDCIFAGTPMLAYPQVNDQFGTAARLAYHGLGLIGDDRDKAPRIEACLRQLTDEPIYREAVERMRQACRRYADKRIAENTVSDMLATA